uniref:Putative secreted protein n=1 Tax=Rhipicephalus microplus TaxID=6941 RepID=A0A6G5A2U2_RHIMP
MWPMRRLLLVPLSKISLRCQSLPFSMKLALSVVRCPQGGYSLSLWFEISTLTNSAIFGSSPHSWWSPHCWPFTIRVQPLPLAKGSRYSQVLPYCVRHHIVSCGRTTRQLKHLPLARKLLSYPHTRWLVI